MAPIVVYSRQREVLTLEAETKHVWVELCSEAALCEDTTRLGQLAAQIAEILRKEQQRLDAKMFPRFEEKNRETGAA